ncbi:DUF5985 family protein [Noviherbaspirillum sp. CPCC 100848]|uniref:DUF5985 family protein n=1 Tax=Noviherbaspirillum album TaxID=3080276 RepID=A0ABU6JAG1_9BURK|nr:DUF5985 family protein [Noviherbaspirillum sp. CPCC 100848]MEC4720635.1 DUF5985 family protein [Noviherbaspirillum sp. CPCC 100848]
MMNTMLLGAIVTASSVIGLFFLRFWRSTGDRFFLFFALSFFIDAVNRVTLGPATPMEDNSPAYYLIRLISYGLILFAIYDKNRPKT